MLQLLLVKARFIFLCYV